MPRNINKPPTWQPDAKPTNRGWVHPKTGELLVSTKSIDLSLFEKKDKNTTKKKKVTKKTNVKKKTSVKKKVTKKTNVKK